MKNLSNKSSKSLSVLMILFGVLLGNQNKAAAQEPVKPTCVMVNLSRKTGVTTEKIQPLMLDEITGTVQAYFDGKILQWYSKTDGTGVVFILNVPTVEEAKALMESLPLGKSGYVDLQYIPLAPLQQLKILLNHVKK
ncbi:MAG: hypothetical protein AAGC65_11665 [Mucilaginibacter sp.]|uniref:hypothetical protein n=1 Tax=Mucilaginibacter sp. TaxID=1882438 RepID=UPI0031A61170